MYPYHTILNIQTTIYSAGNTQNIDITSPSPGVLYTTPPFIHFLQCMNIGGDTVDLKKSIYILHVKSMKPMGERWSPMAFIH